MAPQTYVFFIPGWGRSNAKAVRSEPGEYPTAPDFRPIRAAGLNLNARAVSRQRSELALSSAQLATYSVVLNLLRPFDLLRSSLQTILITEAAQQRRLEIGRIARYAALPLVGLALIYVSFGKFALHLIFSGRYDDGQVLITALVPAAFFQAMYTVPFSVITGRGAPRQLRRFIGIDSGIGLAGLGLLWETTRRWMALGTAASMAVIWATRTVLGLRIFAESDGQTVSESDRGRG